MKTVNVANALLMLAILCWGTLLGGIVYSHIVYFPVYLSDLPASAVVVNGPYGLSEGLFWVIIHPLLILSMVAALVSNWKTRSRRNPIALSFVIYVFVLIVSSIYFIPQLALFKHSPESTVTPAEWLVRGKRWQQLSWVRGAVMYIGILPLLFALTRTPISSRITNDV